MRRARRMNTVKREQENRANESKLLAQNTKNEVSRPRLQEIELTLRARREPPA